jgi:hypothetical protein
MSIAEAWPSLSVSSCRSTIRVSHETFDGPDAIRTFFMRRCPILDVGFRLVDPDRLLYHAVVQSRV